MFLDMNSASFNYGNEDQKQIPATGSERNATTNTESFTPSENRPMNKSDNMYAALPAQYQGRSGNELLAMLCQQEPRVADAAPSTADVDLMNFRMNNSSDLLFDEAQSTQSYFMGANRAESVTSSSHGNMWTDASSMSSANVRPESVTSNMWDEEASSARNEDIYGTFDFLVKSLSSASNLVSMLNREQLAVLRSMRPDVLYQFLQEVIKARSDKRLRRAYPNECAFCKNNGENEECYTSHSLKDWRGRVLCPVLRAFRCPRCSATGDRAHTIKYCPENPDTERSGFAARRRIPPSTLMMNPPSSAGFHGGLRTPRPATPQTPGTPATTPTAATAGLTHTSVWAAFGLN